MMATDTTGEPVWIVEVQPISRRVEDANAKRAEDIARNFTYVALTTHPYFADVLVRGPRFEATASL
jgi:hypothetical protein